MSKENETDNRKNIDNKAQENPSGPTDAPTCSQEDMEYNKEEVLKILEKGYTLFKEQPWDTENLNIKERK